MTEPGRPSRDEGMSTGDGHERGRSQGPTVKAPTGARLGRTFIEMVQDLARDLFDPYRPELHYMRGPGPKWQAKHAPAVATGASPAKRRYLNTVSPSPDRASVARREPRLRPRCDCETPSAKKICRSGQNDGGTYAALSLCDP